MIAVLSTSSPLASVAVFDGSGKLVYGEERLAQRNASSALALLLDGWGGDLSQISVWCADVGPGSFTGVRVAVTMAKSLAYALGSLVHGVSAFDLILGDGPKVIPCRRGQVFVSNLSNEVEVSDAVPDGAVGYLPPGIDAPELFEERFPIASHAEITSLTPTAPFDLAPAYLTPPAISQPKVPYGSAHA